MRRKRGKEGIGEPGDERYRYPTRHERIIANAREAESEGTSTVKVADKADLIWLKEKRNSKQDQADIARLRNEES